MADREIVISGLEHCSNKSFCNDGCPYSPILKDPDFGIDECITQLAHDALELLKEQETTEYGYNEYTNPACKKCGFRPFAGYIPTLKWMQQRGYNYCPGCGKKVKWDD